MKPVIRQWLVIASTQLAALSMGGFIVYPTQVLHQLKSNDSTIQLDMSTASWIGSINGLAGILVIFLPMLMQWRGRKFTYIITCGLIIAGWAISSVADSTALLLTSEVFQGLATNSVMPVSCLIMTEMLGATYRSISLMLFSTSIGIGMTFVGVSGRFIHYKIFSLIMLVPIVMSVILSFSWPESPPWLACKGHFEKCRKAFKMLRGEEESSMSELDRLIAAQQENLAMTKFEKQTTLKSIWVQITSRDFYMPSLHIFLLQNMMYWSSGDVILVYFLEFVEKTTHNENAVFYAGIACYTIVLLNCIISNFTVRAFKNKIVLIFSTLGVILSLICGTMVTFLQSIGVIAENSFACVYCLLAFITFNTLGLNDLVFTIGSELMPVKHRGIGGALYIIINCGLYALTLKLSPYIILCIGMSGMFALFTANAIISVILVWRYVPETKGRTLQEIEDFYTYGHFIPRNLERHE